MKFKEKMSGRSCESQEKKWLEDLVKVKKKMTGRSCESREKK